MSERFQTQSGTGHDLKLSRRRLGRLLAGGALLVATACRHGSSAKVADPTTPSQSPMPDRPRFPGGVATPTPTATRTTRPTPPARSSETPVPDPQILYRGGFTVDPASHDFNASLTCGGDPSLFSGLLTLNTDLTPMGDWAESWVANDDASTWTFHLRPGNHGWSNGEAVTAQDFVWSWQRLLNPETKAPQAWLLFDVVNAMQIHSGQAKQETLGARAVDKWTLEVNLVGPRVYFPVIVATVGTAPAYQPAVEQFGAKWTEAGNCISNGPFLLTEWQHGDHWTTSPNSGHWNFVNVRLEETVVPITPSIRHQQPYFNHQVDFMPVQSDDVANIRSISDYSGQMSGSVDPAVWFLIVNPAVFPFDNQDARRAIAHSIDRDRLEQLSQGRASAAHSLLPSTFPARAENTTIKALQQFDVDKALELLSNTEFANGSGWPPVTLLTAENTEVPQLLANDCAQQLLENLGLKVDVKTVSQQEYDASLSARSAGLYWHRWDFTYPDPNNGYADAFFPSGSDHPLLPLVPPGLGDLVGRAKVEKDADARIAIYRQCETALQAAVSYIPIAYPVTFYLIRPWVAGFPLAGNSSVLQPGLIFTRLTSLVSIKGRPLG